MQNAKLTVKFNTSSEEQLDKVETALEDLVSDVIPQIVNEVTSEWTEPKSTDATYKKWLIITWTTVNDDKATETVIDLFDKLMPWLSDNFSNQVKIDNNVDPA